MKISQEKLKKIIKEEIERVVSKEDDNNKLVAMRDEVLAKYPIEGKESPDDQTDAWETPLHLGDIVKYEIRYRPGQEFGTSEYRILKHKEKLYKGHFFVLIEYGDYEWKAYDLNSNEIEELDAYGDEFKLVLPINDIKKRKLNTPVYDL